MAIGSTQLHAGRFLIWRATRGTFFPATSKHHQTEERFRRLNVKIHTPNSALGASREA